MNEFLQPKAVMRRRPNPLLTVVYPAVDVRGPAVQRLRTWTQGQTLPREAYRVIVGCDCKKPSEESELASLLAANDELIRLPNASDAELWNEAALRASSPWLLFTEGHCLAATDCLEAVAKWIKEDLSAEVGNFAIEHDEQCALAALSRRWFAMVFREWEGHWPRVQRAGFAIRSDLFKRIGGFDSRYGPICAASSFCPTAR